MGECSRPAPWRPPRDPREHPLVRSVPRANAQRTLTRRQRMIRRTTALVTAVLLAPAGLARAQSEVRHDRRELRHDRREAREDRRDLRRTEELLARFDRARDRRDRGGLAAVDRAVEDELRHKWQDTRVEMARDRHEVRRAPRRRRSRRARRSPRRRRRAQHRGAPRRDRPGVPLAPRPLRAARARSQARAPRRARRPRARRARAGPPGDPRGSARGARGRRPSARRLAVARHATRPDGGRSSPSHRGGWRAADLPLNVRSPFTARGCISAGSRSTYGPWWSGTRIRARGRGLSLIHI